MFNYGFPPNDPTFMDHDGTMYIVTFIWNAETKTDAMKYIPKLLQYCDRNDIKYKITMDRNIIMPDQPEILDKEKDRVLIRFTTLTNIKKMLEVYDNMKK